MKKLVIYLSYLICFVSYSQQANFEVSGIAPNFFGYDLEENYQELNSYLSDGKIVFDGHPSSLTKELAEQLYDLENE